jgi:hypothetical protein
MKELLRNIFKFSAENEDQKAFLRYFIEVSIVKAGASTVG